MDNFWSGKPNPLQEGEETKLPFFPLLKLAKLFSNNTLLFGSQNLHLSGPNVLPSHSWECSCIPCWKLAVVAEGMPSVGTPKGRNRLETPGSDRSKVCSREKPLPNPEPALGVSPSAASQVLPSISTGRRALGIVCWGFFSPAEANHTNWKVQVMQWQRCTDKAGDGTGGFGEFRTQPQSGCWNSWAVSDYLASKCWWIFWVMCSQSVKFCVLKSPGWVFAGVAFIALYQGASIGSCS